MYSADAYLIFSVLISIGGAFFISRLLYCWPWSNCGLGEKFLFVIRVLAIAFFIMLLFNPVIQHRNITNEKPVVEILVDNSHSMQLIADSGALDQMVYGLEQMADALSNRYDVRFSYFDSDIYKSVEQSFTGVVTDIASALTKIADGQNPPESLIFVSDGNYNQGQNPSFLSHTLPFPIYSIVIGDTVLPNSVFIQNLNFNSVGYIKEQNPVEIELRNQVGDNDTTVNIQILSNNVVLTSKKVHLQNDKQRKMVSLYFEPTKTGVQEFNVRIGNDTQKQHSFFMDIRKQKQEVLVLYHAVHPDIGAIQRALKNSNRFEPILYSASDFKGSVTDYSFVVMHQIPSGDFMEDKWFADVLENKIPYWIILGESTDYSMFNQGQKVLNIDNRNGEFEDASVVFSPNFNWFKTHPSLTSNIAFWPPLSVAFGDYNQLLGQSLFTQSLYGVETERAAWLFRDKPYRMSVLCGTGIWKWRMHEFRLTGNAAVVDDLIYKVVRFLSLDEPKKRLIVDYEKMYDPTHSINFNAVWYNENFERDNVIPGEVNIVDSSGVNFSFKFWPKGNEYAANIGTLKPGRYRFNASFKDGKEIFLDSGRFMVSNLNIEAHSGSSNIQLMRDLSGSERLFALSEMNRLKQVFLDSKLHKSVRRISFHYDDLINQNMILLIIVLLLFFEWVWRKFIGV